LPVVTQVGAVITGVVGIGKILLVLLPLAVELARFITTQARFTVPEGPGVNVMMLVLCPAVIVAFVRVHV